MRMWMASGLLALAPLFAGCYAPGPSRSGAGCDCAVDVKNCDCPHCKALAAGQIPAEACPCEHKKDGPPKENKGG